MAKDKVVKEVKGKLAPRPQKTIDYSKGVSTGCTVLNLACSGKPFVGFLPGLFYHFCGDSQSGKTFLALTSLAEASINKNFDNFDLVYDAPERGALMDFEKYFGKKAASRLRPPGANGQHSTTMESFFYHLDDAFKRGKPFFYVLDSEDSLQAEADDKKFQQKKKAFRKAMKKQSEDDDGEGAKKEEQVAGSYGTAKAKTNSQNLGWVTSKLAETGSILLVISQSRDNVGTFSFEKKTYSGGHALKFYASLQLWSSLKEHMKKRVKGKEREVGIICKVRVKKNRMTGRDRSVFIPLYHSFGIDDISANINYLLDEKRWKKEKGLIHATDWDVKLDPEELVHYVEQNKKQRELSLLVDELWCSIEEELKVERVSRYA